MLLMPGSAHVCSHCAEWAIAPGRPPAGHMERRACRLYLIAFGGLPFLAGRMGDLTGQRRVFLIGPAMFTGSAR